MATRNDNDQNNVFPTVGGFTSGSAFTERCSRRTSSPTSASRSYAPPEESAFRARVKQKELELYAAIEPRKVLALALLDLGRNADRIGNLTITSEILASLLNGKGGANGSAGE